MVLVAFACLLFAAAACEEDDGTPPATPTAPAATAPPARPTATPAPEGTREDGAIESPEAALRRQIDLLNSGNFGEEWDELHPAQQAVVTRERFIDCIGANDFQLTLDIVETQDAVIDIPGVARAPGKVIATRLTSGGQALDRNFSEVLVDGRWRWVLEKPSIDAYAAGRCP